MRWQGTGWLWVGVALALVVPATGADRALLASLSRLLPLPWGRLLLGALLFMAAAALYFRSHWAACERARARAARESGIARAGAGEDFDELERSLALARDNLHETEPPSRLAQLYHEGAVEHLERAIRIVERIRRRPPAPAPTRAADGDDKEQSGYEGGPR